MGYSANGLELEVVGREIAGRPVAGRSRRRYGPLLLGLPAALLGALLVVPILITTVAAFRTDGRFGLGNFRVAFGTDGGRAFLHSAGWIVVALAVSAVGFGIALAGHGAPWLWRLLQPALVVPFAMSALVSGAAFRMVFDQSPDKGTVSAVADALFGSSPVWLGPGLIWVVLISAFAWMWLGFAVSLFRAGLDAIPEDVARTVRAEGLRRWRRLRAVELPILRPITGIVVVTLVVAAVRIFDLVLIATPQPMQDEATVLSLRWWQLTTASGAAGPPAALALVLFALAAAVALLGVRGLRRSWAMPPMLERPAAPDPPDRRQRVVGLAVAVPVGLLWAFPVLVLLATAFHDQRSAGLAGWWSLSGLGLKSFGAASAAGLWQALAVSGVIAALATAIVLAVAVPTAYLLAWGGLPPWLGRAVTTGFVVLAVTPVQMYAGPLRTAFEHAGLSASRIPLAFVHAAAGLPFAVVLLRAAFASAPADLIAGALLGRLRQGSVLNQVRRSYQPALIAVAVLELVLVWNDFIVGFLVAGPGSTTSSLVLWGQARQFVESTGPVAAAATLSSAVPVALLLVFWPTVVRGLTVGSKP